MVASGGVASAANLVFSAVTGSGIYYVVIYRNTGGDSTSALIVLIDSAAGLPLFPTGSAVTLAWDTGPYKIFQL
jgi:hypothetical protein